MNKTTNSVDPGEMALNLHCFQKVSVLVYEAKKVIVPNDGHFKTY